MREEEIANCKSHIAPFSLTDWHIMIFYKKKFKTSQNKIVDHTCSAKHSHYSCYQPTHKVVHEKRKLTPIHILGNKHTVQG